MKFRIQISILVLPFFLAACGGFSTDSASQEPTPSSANQNPEGNPTTFSPSQHIDFEYQSNLAPQRGQTLCRVTYANSVPNKFIDLNVGVSGSAMGELQRYKQARGTYSNAGRLMITLVAPNLVDITFANDRGLSMKAKGLAIANLNEVFEANGALEVMGKVVFQVDNLIKVSCAAQP